MGDFTETPTYGAAVHEIATTEPLLGGPGGNLNVPLGQLVDRTAYLKVERDKLPVQTAGTEGVKQLGNSQQAVTSNGKTTTLAAGTLFAQLVTLLTEFVKHRGSSEAGWGDDHDGRYPARQLASSSGAAAGQTLSLYTGPGIYPPVFSIFYSADGNSPFYAAGTGPYATDLEITLEESAGDWTLKVTNTHATQSLTIKRVVYDRTAA